MKIAYAKIISPTVISLSVPRSAVIDGELVVGTLPRDYLASIGWFPLNDTPRPEPEEGYQYERSYERQGDEIVAIWTKVQNPPPPPRTWTPLSIKRACAERWPALREALQEADIYEDFIMAKELREDDDAFRQGYDWAVETYGKETVDKVLADAYSGGLE
ncbi:MAG: hypothetical protein J6V72_19740 [Kiritimatiellae bacterium]|nr:hypothetical protein [Kiritimatiellia bacterium]